MDCIKFVANSMANNLFTDLFSLTLPFIEKVEKLHQTIKKWLFGCLLDILVVRGYCSPEEIRGSTDSCLSCVNWKDLPVRLMDIYCVRRKTWPTSQRTVRKQDTSKKMDI